MYTLLGRNHDCTLNKIKGNLSLPSLFSQAAEKAIFPHFKHNNSADTQYLNAKLSDIPSLGYKPKVSEPFYNLVKIFQY